MRIGIRKGEVVELYESVSVEEVEERIGLRFEEDGGYWKEIEEGDHHDPTALELYCEMEPDADECRMYDD